MDLLAQPGQNERGKTMSTMIKVSPQEFLRAYNLYDDGMYQIVLMVAMRKLAPVFKNQATDDAQTWLDSFAQIVHQTSQIHRENPIVFTTDAVELEQFVGDSNRQWLAEREQA